MNIKKKPLAALIVSAALMFQSCGFIILNDLSAENEVPDNEASESENENVPQEYDYEYTKYVYTDSGHSLAEQYLETIPERDYEGAVFFITTSDKSYISPDDTGSVVSRLAVQRNAEVSEKLNLTMIFNTVDSGTMLDELKEAVASGSYYTDLLMVPVYTVGTYKMSGTLINLRNVPFFDVNQPYFNVDSSVMTSGGYSTYAITGDASVSPHSFTGVFMNTDILNDAGYSANALYSTVIDGTWTWDRYLEICSSVVKMNSDFSTSYNTTTTQNLVSRLPDLIFKSSGKNYINTGERTVPAMGFNARTAKITMNNMYAVYNDGWGILDENTNAADDFAAGKSMFLIDYLSVMDGMTETPARWGVLPLPKEIETGEYRTLISNNELVFAVPRNHTNPETAAITLSALNAASYGYIYDEYVNYQFAHVLRDNPSADMLDIILDTATFDFALAFGNAYPTIGDATYRLIRQCARSNDLAEKYVDLAKIATDTMHTYFDLSY